jgi:hypothetical protein
MAQQPNPNDPYGTNLGDEELRRQARLNNLDNELQPDPALSEGPPSRAKVTMFAIAIAVILGALFYGLNNTTVNQVGTTPPSQTAQNPPNPAAPSGAKINTEPGTTTGAAPNRPAPPQQTTPDSSKQ